ncbi:MAG: formate dehydrogenase accessory protein FdhE [Acidobacteriota bacterium]
MRSALAVRAARARHLARAHPESREALEFYAALAELQRSFVDSPGVISADAARVPFAAALDADRAALLVPPLLAWCRDEARGGVASTLLARPSTSRPDWPGVLSRCWISGGPVDEDLDDIDRFLAEAVLQPFAELAATGPEPATGATPARAATGARCPVCGGLPVVGTLRERGHGAARAFVCGFCLTEWPAARIGCPSCGETTFERLPVFRADEFRAARIDACDTCRACLKTIDLTVDGTALPVVDDVATLALDLWAVAQGYRKVRLNLLRL